MPRVLIVWDTTETHSAEIDLADYNGDPSSIDTDLLAQHEADGRNPDREVAEVVAALTEED